MDREKEPGTARYGNFINYYTFNPPDKRIGLLPSLDHLDTLFPDLADWEQTHILDVGSNAGVSYC